MLTLDLDTKIAKKRERLKVSSITEVEKETKEYILNEKLKEKINFIKKNKSFLGLVQTWKIKTLEVAAKLSDFIPEQDTRIEMKCSISKKINEFRNDNLPITKRRYSR